jgi:hypothetical protein
VFDTLHLGRIQLAIIKSLQTRRVLSCRRIAFAFALPIVCVGIAAIYISALDNV